jgi:hypothetical protein
MKIIILVLCTFVLLLAGCGGGNVHLAVDSEISIPEGYMLIGASAYSDFNIVTLYIQNKKSGHVYEYENDKIGSEIIPPEGYSLVAVSTYSDFNFRTFYCRNNLTGQVFTCPVEHSPAN